MCSLIDRLSLNLRPTVRTVYFAGLGSSAWRIASQQGYREQRTLEHSHGDHTCHAWPKDHTHCHEDERHADGQPASPLPPERESSPIRSTSSGRTRATVKVRKHGSQWGFRSSEGTVHFFYLSPVRLCAKKIPSTADVNASSAVSAVSNAVTNFKRSVLCSGFLTSACEVGSSCLVRPSLAGVGSRPAI